MHILINGTPHPFTSPLSIQDAFLKYSPQATKIILNGFEVHDKTTLLKKDDQLTFITPITPPTKKEIQWVLQSRHTPNIAKKLQKSIVGIAGLGGLGSHVAFLLARMGVGTLVLADFDVVDLSNLNRQQYFFYHVGKPKTQALKESLNHINPYLTYQTYNVRVTPKNFLEIFRDCDILIEAFDDAQEKTMLIKESQKTQKITIAASGVAGYGHNDTIMTKKINSTLYIIGDFTSEAKPNQGLMAPRVSIAAAKQANLAIELLLT